MRKSSKTTISAHYISGTHWDREWYRPFQEYRILLVDLIDELIELMETSKAFKYFQLDGQTCILEDYLEIRPENRPRIAALIKAKRILIGPWYTMPDLFCPDDESLVRNLLLGRRIAREWETDPMPVGFICDMFGHPSQMPQIFAGFGIDDIVMGRGTNEFNTPMFFQWESPDGSKALTFKLQDMQGYGAFALPRAIMEGAAGVAAEQVPDKAQYLSDLQAAGSNKKKLKAVREKWGKITLADYINHEIDRANAPVIAVMDSMDHIAPAGDVATYLKLIKEGCKGVKPAHSTLPKFFEDVRQHVGRLPRREGELREPSRDDCNYLYLIPNCVSARVQMKQANDDAATLLERWAEPMMAFAAIAGIHRKNSLKPYIDLAWKHLISNHAHDSICGCSIDQVHRDMMTRYDQVAVIGRQVRHQVLADLTTPCADLAQDDQEFTVCLVNPLPFERNDSLVFAIDLPPDYPAVFNEGFRTQELKAFTLEDCNGKPVDFQYLSFIPETGERSHVAKYCFVNDGPFTRYTVAANVSVPAGGFTALKVKPSAHPVRTYGSLRTGPVSAENKHLAIEIAANGTLSLTDKSTGKCYRELLTFEDRSEVGDGWFHGHSLNDSRVLSSAATAQVEVLHDGPELVTFRVKIELNLPIDYDWYREAPNKFTAPMLITNEITLTRHGKAINVKTIVDNGIKDHQLQLLLPTGIETARDYLAHTGFDIVKRPIALDPQTVDWQEMDVIEKPFQDLQAVTDGKNGLAFISGGGLHEGGVRDDAGRTMQVTLLRAFRRTVGTHEEEDGLEQGRLEFNYALMPFSGRFPAVAALQQAAALQTGIITRQTGKRPSGYPPMTGKQCPQKSFIRQTKNSLFITAIKPAEQGDGVIVRLWNPEAKAVRELLKVEGNVKSVRTVELSESPSSNSYASLTRSGIRIEAPARKIITLKLELK